jgi:glycyl-tRNA synthetase (class II)
MEANNEVVIRIGNEGKEIRLTKEFVTFEAYDKVIQEEKYTPSVIEPSFGNTKTRRLRVI